ncbi:MAG: PQQ-dependent sugar dehydrogenase, partial [bacterium]
YVSTVTETTNREPHTMIMNMIRDRKRLSHLFTLFAGVLLLLAACGEGAATPTAVVEGPEDAVQPTEAIEATDTVEPTEPAPSATPEPEETEAATEEPATATAEATEPAEEPTAEADDPTPEGREWAVDLELVADGFTAPLAIVPVDDGSGRHLVMDQTGLIYVLDEEGQVLDTPFLDVRERLVTLDEGYDERGLLGLALHPQYAENGRFFVYYSAPLRDEAPQEWNHTSHVSEFQVSADDENVADPGSERILMQIDQPQGNHDGGQIAFGPDGYLYIPLGDGGGANDTGEGHVEDWYEFNDGGNAQAPENLLGSILRIDVDDEGEEGQPYAIPQDNPFVEDEEVLDETWAYGFRNPFGISFDMEGDNELFVGDAGQDRWEEVSIVEAGGNYGWNVKEGTHCFDAANPGQDLEECPGETPDGQPLIDPVIEYLNGNQEGGLGLVVIGGNVYRGSALPNFVGNYFFGDWSTSFGEPDGTLLLALPPDTDDEQAQGETWPIQEVTIANAGDGRLNEYLLSFGQDLDGELFLLTSETPGPTGDTGKVYKIVHRGVAPDLD